MGSIPTAPTKLEWDTLPIGRSCGVRQSGPSAHSPEQRHHPRFKSLVSHQRVSGNGRVVRHSLWERGIGGSIPSSPTNSRKINRGVSVHGERGDRVTLLTDGDWA